MMVHYSAHLNTFNHSVEIRSLLQKIYSASEYLIKNVKKTMNLKW